MSEHKLSLEFPKTLDEGVLMIIDTSTYNDLLDVECAEIHIAPPGFSYSNKIEVDEIGFRKNLTACDIGLQHYSCDDENDSLPDGLYKIRYSICPVDLVYVEYFHLRTTKLMNRYYNLLCEIDLSACEPTKDVRKDLDRLRDIRMYIEAAEAKIGICHDVDKGMELFKYAKKLLDKFECKSC